MTDDNKSAFDEESTDFYDEFKDRMRQEPLKSVLTQSSQSSKPIGGIITVLIGVFLAALVLWYIVGKYFVSGDSEIELAPPVITADNEVVKERPEDVGGMEILGKDKSVYNRISRSNSNEPERIIRRVETPVPAPVEQKEKVKVQVMDTGSPLIHDMNAQKTGAPKPTLPKALAETSITKAMGTVVAEPKAEERKVEVKPVYTPQKTEVKPVPVPAKPVVAKKGDWKIQILSSRDKNAVAKTWESLKSKHSDLLGDITHEVVEADLGAKGMFYRLRIGGFTDRKQADDLCSKLKIRKLDCIVTN